MRPPRVQLRQDQRQRRLLPSTALTAPAPATTSSALCRGRPRFRDRVATIGTTITVVLTGSSGCLSEADEGRAGGALICLPIPCRCCRHPLLLSLLLLPLLLFLWPLLLLLRFAAAALAAAATDRCGRVTAARPAARPVPAGSSRATIECSRTLTDGHRARNDRAGAAAGQIMQSNGLRIRGLTNFHTLASARAARTWTRSRWRRRRRRPTFASPVRAPPARTTHPSRLPVSPPAQPPTACVLFGGRARRGSSASTRRRTPGRRPALCAVRVRPLNAREKAGDADCAWKIKKNHITSTGGDRDVSLHFGEPAATPLPLNSHHSAP